MASMAMTNFSCPIEKIVLKAAASNHLPPVLLVHGAWHAAWCWEKFALALNQKGHEVHYFSLPGHGASSLYKRRLNDYSLSDYVDFLSDRIDEIKPTPVVIGHSMGGALLRIYLQKKTLPAAIFIASIPERGTLSLIARIAVRFPLALLKAMLLFRSEVIVETAERARALFYSPDNPIDYVAAQKRLGPESMRILLPLMYWRSFKNIIAGTPVYVIAGEKDRITSVSEQRALAKNLAAEFSVVEGQAHCMMLEPKYTSVVNLVDRWIRHRRMSQAPNT